MNRVTRRWAAVVLGAGAWFASAAPAPGADRSAEQILREIDAVKYPTFDAKKRQDPAYMREYLAQRQAVWSKLDPMILELYKVAPNHERIPKLMNERWSRMLEPFGKLYKDVDDILAHDQNPKLRIEGAFVKARARISETRRGGSPDLVFLEEFLKLAPKDPRGPSLLQTAIGYTRDEKAKAILEERLLKDFPESPYATIVQGARRQRAMIGKPFELEFTDAIKGTTISIKGLKGKVVVIDFWATWCGPCVAEMPKMKELYAKYRDQGVEFIGVSLDQPKEKGGLDRLKAFVKEKEIAWPQYYQGNYWQSEFSWSWGITSIPRVFVVDQEGKLYSVDARGKLETIIPELLKNKAGAAGAGGE
ncbi:MAG TPA: TlpA disulfide reductase family protein [Isosphaeraceae bacterium]|nr:TlpA disulfide reductase family protein [Isosphaeraceae bacterium]